MGAGLVHAVLLAGAFPPLGLWGLALVAPIPLAWLIERANGRPGRAGLLAAAGVLPFWLFEQAWVSKVSALGYVPMCIYLALFTWLTVWIGGRLRRAFGRVGLALILPVAWVGVDYARGAVLFDGYPWYFVAHPLIAAPFLAWPASLLGVYSVTFLVVAVCGAAFDWISRDRGRARTGGIVFGLAVLILIAGVVGSRPPAAGAPLARVAVVQTNVPQDNKVGWGLAQRLTDWARFEDLARRAASAVPSPDLIVLPETMFPGLALDARSLEIERSRDLAWTSVSPPLPTTWFADRLLDLQQELGLPIMIGAMGYDGMRFETNGQDGPSLAFDDRFNSVVVVSGGAVEPVRYDKQHLTPFGEVMPYISLWPWLESRLLALGASGMAFDLSAGRGPVVLRVALASGATLRAATPICFEATMPGICRSLVFQKGQRRADVLINLTNDGWFGWSDAGRRQHLQLARWRCLELATPMVRAANTGISALIDAGGRLIRSGVEGGANQARVDGVLVVDVPAPGPATFYSSVGDGFGALVAAGAALAGLFTFRLKPRADR